MAIKMNRDWIRIAADFFASDAEKMSRELLWLSVSKFADVWKLDREKEPRCLRRKPMGAEKILKQNPHDRPGKIARSPAPLCHASSRRRFWKYANVYRAFVEQYRAASTALRDGDLSAIERFAPRCFLPAFPQNRV